MSAGRNRTDDMAINCHWARISQSAAWVLLAVACLTPLALTQQIVNANPNRPLPPPANRP